MYDCDYPSFLGSILSDSKTNHALNYSLSEAIFSWNVTESSYNAIKIVSIGTKHIIQRHN